jgi:CDP-diacylglycerol--glycerol-3-phosphate 3-phosphatidyltransferase
MTLYRLKPKFQALLRPIARWIHQRGGTANQVTVAAAVGSVALGALLALVGPWAPSLFLLLPQWLLVRMALNASYGQIVGQIGMLVAVILIIRALPEGLSSVLVRRGR